MLVILIKFIIPCKLSHSFFAKILLSGCDDYFTKGVKNVFSCIVELYNLKTLETCEKHFPRVLKNSCVLI